MYDIKNVPIGDLFIKYPQLESLYYEAVNIHADNITHKPLSVNQLMAFIVLSYHLKSPLVREASIHKRRAEALRALGFVLSSEQDFSSQPELTQFITGSNTFVNRLALHFCKFEGNVSWAELCMLQDMMDDVFITLKEESAGTEKKSANEMLKIKIEVMQKAQPFRDKMQEIATQLFAGDTELLNHAAAYMVLEKRAPLITPERIAKLPKQEAIKEINKALYGN